jgi:hypothetical protein
MKRHKGHTAHLGIALASRVIAAIALSPFLHQPDPASAIEFPAHLAKRLRFAQVFSRFPASRYI